MLVSITVKNWLSFRDEATLSLRASRERTHVETLHPLPKKYGTGKILPIAAVYGQNASGKTALFEAMQLMQRLVISSPDPDDLTGSIPFLLDPDSREAPTELSAEVLLGERIFRYSLSLKPEGILEESLMETLAKTNFTLFRRSDDLLGGDLDSDLNRAIMDNLPANQTFLNAAVKLGSEQLRPIYDWFAKSLKLVGLEASYREYSQMMVREDFREFAGDILRKYAGIDGIGLQPVEEGDVKNRLRSIVAKHSKKVDSGFTGIHHVISRSSRNVSYYFIQVEDGKVTDISRMAMRHRMPDGSTVNFDVESESAGTQRLVDLMPAFFDLDSSEDGQDNVYFIDEIDQSFHTAMTHDLVKRFLDSCTHESRKQLVFNLHDLSLMDSPILRKDELWVCDKDNDVGTSSLKNIGRYTGMRSDTNILKAYKTNVFGGYPG